MSCRQFCMHELNPPCLARLKGGYVSVVSHLFQLVYKTLNLGAVSDPSDRRKKKYMNILKISKGWILTICWRLYCRILLRLCFLFTVPDCQLTDTIDIKALQSNTLKNLRTWLTKSSKIQIKKSSTCSICC